MKPRDELSHSAPRPRPSPRDVRSGGLSASGQIQRRMNSMKLRMLGVMFALSAALCVSRPACASDNDVIEGHRYFIRYCASCHGIEGLGDGPVAASLSTRPTSLRKLGDKYGVPLPAHRMAELIDGRDEPRAHGTREMPVWGERLYELGQGEKGEYGISEVIRKLIAYLNTIQDRRTASR